MLEGVNAGEESARKMLENNLCTHRAGTYIKRGTLRVAPKSYKNLYDALKEKNLWKID